MAARRVGGILRVTVDGQTVLAKGSAKYQLGTSKKTGVVGADRVHGYKEEPMIPYVELTVTDTPDLDLRAFFDKSNATITVEGPNGKGCTLSESWFAADGVVDTAEGEIECKWEGIHCEELSS